MVNQVNDISAKRPELKVSWETVDKAINNLAKTIVKSGGKFDFIYGIPRGGLIPAVMLSHRIGIPVVTDLNHKGKILIVDDVLDSGKTIKDFSSDDRWTTAVVFVLKGRSAVKAHFYGDVMKTGRWLVFPWEVSGGARDKN